MKRATSKDDLQPSQRITQYIGELTDWRGKMLARLRKLILEAAPSIAEEWKWETPVWSHHGNVVAGGVFQDHVKLNFFKGASLNDPHGLFNAGLEAKATRAIDIHQGDTLDEAVLKDLIRAAVALNSAKPKTSKAATQSMTSKRPAARKRPKK
jgi:hypothetical protein